MLGTFWNHIWSMHYSNKTSKKYSQFNFLSDMLGCMLAKPLHLETSSELAPSSLCAFFFSKPFHQADELYQKINSWFVRHAFLMVISSATWPSLPYPQALHLSAHEFVPTFLVLKLCLWHCLMIYKIFSRYMLYVRCTAYEALPHIG